jgi:hypothetical protein
MTTEAEPQVRKFCAELGDFRLMNESNRYNCRNMLAGFLQACERLGCMTHDEAQTLFAELAG